MDLNIGEITAEIQREINLNGTDIVLEWNRIAPGAVVNPVDKSVDAGDLIAATATLKAFVHQAQPTGASSVRQFNEVEVGDLILDFMGDADVDNKRDLVFVVGGKRYVPKEIGPKLAQSWDVTVQNAKLFRSVLVKAQK